MSSLPAAKKLKVSPRHELSSGSHAPSFVDILDEALMLISEYATPPEIYNLCLTNQTRFFRSAGNDAMSDTNESTVVRGGNAPDALFCTKLLRSSLMSSLSRVLRDSTAGLSIDQVSFSNIRQGSVLLTGSTMVQCCLGELWEGRDLDIFCTTEAAPAVRSWLVKEAGQIFEGFCDTYVGVEDITHPIDSKIHHVEYYSPRPDDGETAGHGFSFDKACDYGKHVNEHYVYWKWKNVLSKAGIHDVVSPKYRIKPLPGDPFPFDFECQNRTAFDLVIATDECFTAAELLKDFDLNICKASWDGKTFSIPDPHYTFSRRSKMEPMRKAVMQSYMRHYDLGNFREQRPTENLARIYAAVRAVDAEVAPLYNVRFRPGTTELILQFNNFVYKPAV